MVGLGRPREFVLFCSSSDLYKWSGSGTGLGGWERKQGGQIKDGREAGVSNQGGDGHEREIGGLDECLGYNPSKSNSHWIMQLNVKPKTVKLLGESRGKLLIILGLAQISQRHIKHKQ